MAKFLEVETSDGKVLVNVELITKVMRYNDDLTTIYLGKEDRVVVSAPYRDVKAALTPIVR